MSKATQPKQMANAIVLKASQIKDLVIDPAHNLSRSYKARTEQEVAAFAEDLITNGVQQPIGVTETEDGKYSVVYGFRRSESAKYAVDNGAEDFEMPAIVVGGDTLALAQKNLIENLHREKPSPMDMAAAVEKLSNEPFNMSSKDIAAHLGFKNDTYVRRYRSLLTIPAKYQKQVHDGRMSADAAFEFAQVAPEDRDKVMQEAEKAKKVEKKTGKETIPTEAIQNAKEAVTQNPINKRRSSATVVKSLQTMAESEEIYGPDAAKFHKELIRFIDGKLTELQYFNRVAKFFPYDAPPVHEEPEADGEEKPKKAKKKAA